MQLIIKDKKTRTAVICPVVKTDDKTLTSFDIKEKEEEARGLVEAMGQTVVFCGNFKVGKVVPRSFFGKGCVENIKTLCEENEAELLVVDTLISAVQQKNLEKELNVKVIDRTAVILEIFGRRAQTNEGKLQVELAHLTYQRGRLVRSWTHLERQRGGGGFLGGPGETQIELDRRHIDNRILKIKKELDKVKKTRAIQRKSRVKVPYPIIALVGYTNAGKSTLFNCLTNAGALAKDMLFATLDPKMRKIELKNKKEAILSDTVGFISNLPHELVMAFRATLEEVLMADIVLHVIDVANPNYKEQRLEVCKVLHELGRDKIETEDCYVEVYNKIDKLDGEIEGKNFGNGVFISAANGKGCDKLLEVLGEKLAKDDDIKEIFLDISDGKGIALEYSRGEVLEKNVMLDEKKIYLKVRYSKNN